MENQKNQEDNMIENETKDIQQRTNKEEPRTEIEWAVTGKVYISSLQGYIVITHHQNRGYKWEIWESDTKQITADGTWKGASEIYYETLERCRSQAEDIAEIVFRKLYKKNTVRLKEE